MGVWILLSSFHLTWHDFNGRKCSYSPPAGENYKIGLILDPCKGKEVRFHSLLP